jgi:hypothetical protein
VTEPTFGLPARPEPDPRVVSLISAAVEELYGAVVVEPPNDGERKQAWRFSGRWWMKPSPLRRERPWANQP